MTISSTLSPKLIRHVLADSRSIRSPRRFTTTATLQAKNRIYDNIRSQPEFDDLLLSSASSRTPLITLWTASWCPSCKTVTPLIRDLIDTQGFAEEDGGVDFAEVEFDSPTIGEVAGRYIITSLPTLMAFRRQEAQLQTRVTDVKQLSDREFLRRWIKEEASKGGGGGSGSGNGFLGVLFWGGR